VDFEQLYRATYPRVRAYARSLASEVRHDTQFRAALRRLEAQGG
jgi:hypothetical protein